MSAIDVFRHTLIGVAQCPSRFELVYGRDHRQVPLYRLDEDCDRAAWDFDGKKGDVLVGGGGGESAALRISIPAAVALCTSETFSEDEHFARRPDDYFKAFWGFSDAFVFGDGYQQLGWIPELDLPYWLTREVIFFLLYEYPEVYGASPAAPPVVPPTFIRRPTTIDLHAWP